MYEQNSSNSFPPPTSATNALASLSGTRNASNSANIPPGALQAANQNPLQPSSVINVSGSSDIVIGPMTQYQGPVTIYQYMDATVEARSMTAGAGINQNRTTQSSSFYQKLSTTSKLIILTLFVLMLVAGITTYFLLEKQRLEHERNTPPEILFGNNYETGIFPNLGNGHLVIDREQWGSAELTKNISARLEHPIPYVLITHVGVQSVPCFNVYKCSIKMRTWQDSSIAEKGLPDISSNFYVGNDGNIYVGRGWDIANTYGNKSLAVTFMGDFIRFEPDEKQLDAVQYLLAYAVTKKLVAIDYKLVAQNQTKGTKSPGPNVFKHIVKLPHWYPCGMGDNPKCGKELGLPEVWNAEQ